MRWFCCLPQPRLAGSSTCTRPPQDHRGRDGGSRRTPFGQSDSLRGLQWVPPKWRCLVPGERRDGAQSRPSALIRVLRNTPKGITQTVEQMQEGQV